MNDKRPPRRRQAKPAEIHHLDVAVTKEVYHLTAADLTTKPPVIDRSSHLSAADLTVDSPDIGKPTLNEVPSPSRSRQHAQRQGDRVRKVLSQLRDEHGNLRYPDGVVPDSVPTLAVTGQVAEALKPESRNLGLGDPSWEVVNRILGRDPNRR
jgi:hypothetical protein